MCHGCEYHLGIQRVFPEILAASQAYQADALTQLGLPVPTNLEATLVDDELAIRIYDRFGLVLDTSAVAQEQAVRIKQAYAIQAMETAVAEVRPGYTFEVVFSTEQDGTFTIRAHDPARNATWSLTLFRDMSSLVDFYDGLFDDYLSEFAAIEGAFNAYGITLAFQGMSQEALARLQQQQASAQPQSQWAVDSR